MRPAPDPNESRLVDRRAFVVGGLQLAGASALALSGTTAAARAAVVQRALGSGRIFLVEDFRRAFELDDTPCLARALAAASLAGGGSVRALPGRTYRVSPQTTFESLNPSGGTCGYPVCLQIASGVTLDMQGSTLQLQGSAEAAVVANTNVTGSGRADSDLGLENVVIDGRDVPFTQSSLLHFAYAERLALRNVKLVNGSYQGAWIYACHHCEFDGIEVDGFHGQPWTFGNPQTTGTGRNQVYDSKFGRLSARNVRRQNGQSQPGNSFNLILTRCEIDSIQARDCDAGIKVQWPSRDVTIHRVFTARCGSPIDENSGFKIQGDPVHGPVRRIHAGRVIAQDQAAMGLFMDYSENCSVRFYSGRRNNKNGTAGDVWIGGRNDRVGRIKSDLSGANGVLIRPYAHGYRLPAVWVRNPGQAPNAANRAAIAVSGGSGKFGHVTCVDTRAVKTMTRGADVWSSTAVGSIARLHVSGQRGQQFMSVSSRFKRGRAHRGRRPHHRKHRA